MNSYVSMVAAGITFSLSSVSFGATSLCSINETVYFSCTTHSGKTASLCGKVFEKDESGRLADLQDQYLQYRFGTPKAVELEFPKTKKDSVGSFRSDVIRAQGGTLRVDAVLFVSSGIAYSVESVVDTGAVSEGVSVGDPKKFGIESQVKRRAPYPDARVRCAERADTKNFFELVNYLAQ